MSMHSHGLGLQRKMQWSWKHDTMDGIVKNDTRYNGWYYKTNDTMVVVKNDAMVDSGQWRHNYSGCPKSATVGVSQDLNLIRRAASHLRN